MLRAPTQQPGPPVLGLLDDVMAEIWASMSVPEAVTVSLVCRQWRHMALRNRALWSQIQLELSVGEDLRDSRLQQFHRDRLAFLVERSGGAYLTFNLTLPAAVDSESLLNILAPLLPHGQRIASLSLSGVNFASGQQTSHALSWTLHHLRLPLESMNFLSTFRS
ncbi:hypothetical protein EXIGLDRAFT_721688 [Exidia glandulosa HHB12029]|uniref:F-box domain-containing protein n=1 Tax=Exidia glandulosa HHB12029 TaxID=1314781 RepID=A0A165QD37_EXIGL|nr:hypothetical protein EXIGLDRAFT_721688 [Exidia glandulosa HHB12029]